MCQVHRPCDTDMFQWEEEIQDTFFLVLHVSAADKFFFNVFFLKQATDDVSKYT